MELNRIYNMDCLDGMVSMQDDSVDCVITSPPYNYNLRVHYGKYGGMCNTDRNKYDYKISDRLPIDEYYKWQKTCIGEMMRVCKGVVFYNIQMLTGNKDAFMRILGDYHDKVKEIIIWDKIQAEPAINDGVLNSMFEFIVVFDKNNAIGRRFENANFERGSLSNVFRIPKNRSKNGINHKAVFPLEIPLTIIKNFTKENDIVLDPFMGIGTTAVACIQTGRFFTGFELNTEYFNYSDSVIQEEFGKKEKMLF